MFLMFRSRLREEQYVTGDVFGLQLTVNKLGPGSSKKRQRTDRGNDGFCPAKTFS